MDLERFEELWPKRDELDQATRDELERLAKTDKQCQAFAEGGDWVRELLLDDEPEVAPADFAYRMRVYAANHSESEAPVPERSSWLRWPVVTVGAVAGVAVMAFVMFPFLQENSVATGPVAETETPAVMSAEKMSAPESIDDGMLADAVDSSLANDSLSTHQRDLPDYPVQTVSGGE
ncbi:hypothetical protein KQI52_01980 [bacterium]|nr:hypothetical protein [bacterium]